MSTLLSAWGDENGVESRTVENVLLRSGVLLFDLTDGDISNASLGIVNEGVPGMVFSSAFVVVVNSASCFNVSAALLRPWREAK